MAPVLVNERLKLSLLRSTFLIAGLYYSSFAWFTVHNHPYVSFTSSLVQSLSKQPPFKPAIF